MRALWIVFAAALVAALFLGFSMLREYRANPLLQESVGSGDYSRAYLSYTGSAALLEERRYMGSDDADVTIVAGIDFSSDASRELYAETIPLIAEQYLGPGRARLYHVYYLSEEEYSSRTGRFIYAAAAACGEGDLIALHSALLGAKIEDVAAIAARHNASAACLADPPLGTDALETRTFRLTAPSLRVGVDLGGDIVLVGVPSPERLDRTVRTQEVTLGRAS